MSPITSYEVEVIAMMIKLEEFADYGLGDTPLYQVPAYCATGNLYVKLEKTNPKGSIKDRTAYYLIKDLVDAERLNPGVKLVESSSGNLGIALAYFARQIGAPFLCLVDPTLPHSRFAELAAQGVETCVVSLGQYPTYRVARIERARELDREPGWIWTNQYDNPANMRAHYETTGPEIWQQMHGRVDYLVCSVGTGGTICGIGRFLKEQSNAIKIVGVEPKGSTIFGGTPGCYLTAGAGMLEPSGIFRQYGHVVDYYSQVDDDDALEECIRLSLLENMCVGITTGAALVVASYLAAQNPESIVVAVSPDGGEKYAEFLAGITPSAEKCHNVVLCEYRPVG